MPVCVCHFAVSIFGETLIDLCGDVTTKVLRFQVDC